MRIVSRPTTPVQRKRALDDSALNTPSNPPPSGRPTRKRSAQTLHAPSFAELYTPSHMENVELRKGRESHGRIGGQTLEAKSTTKLPPSSPSPLPLASASAASSPSIVASYPTDLFGPAVSLFHHKARPTAAVCEVSGLI